MADRTDLTPDSEMAEAPAEVDQATPGAPEREVASSGETPAETSAQDAPDETAAGIAAVPATPEVGVGPAEGADEMVEAPVDAGRLAELEEMGFSRARCVRCLHALGRFDAPASIEAAVEWLSERAEETELDEPLLVTRAECERLKTPLDPAEAKARAEELLARARERREAEEARLERERELNRVRVGKELTAAQRQEEELRLKRNLEARRIEKAEEARARAKVRAKLEEDRKERRRKLGLPEELTEEEKAAEAEREKAKAEREEKRGWAALPAKPVGAIDELRRIAVAVKKDAKANGEADAAVATCFQTLLRLSANAATKPDEDKYRHIKLAPGAPLAKRLLPGAESFLLASGWVRDATFDADGALSLPREPEVSARLTAAGEVLTGALNNPFFGAL